MKLTFTVTGMTCAACSARVEKVSRAVPGVVQADVNLLAGTMQAELDTMDTAQAVITLTPLFRVCPRKVTVMPSGTSTVSSILSLVRFQATPMRPRTVPQ